MAVLFTIDDVSVRTEEFSYIYKKNNLNKEEAFNKEDIDEYLELFINFKLKVTEARALGYDTTKSYIEELDKYQDQLTKPYLSEKEVTNQLLAEAYQRMKYEVDVSHILVLVSPDASPEDTIKAYNKINEALRKSKEGSDFESLVLQYSEEPMVEITKGRLGYFTALQMVYPFENMAYNTSVGEVSAPFRTQFGYHILKVHDKRPAHGKVSVSHILLRFNASMSKSDSTEIQNRIFGIYDQLASGYDWDLMCREVSEDLNSKDRGGSLSPFGVGEMIPEIIEAAFSLKEEGDISDPVMTQYGWHILKLKGTTPLPSFEDYENQLSRRIQRDSRSNKSKEVLISRLKRENGFIENTDKKAEILKLVDSSSFSGNWIPNLQNRGRDGLFSLLDSVYTSEQFVLFVNNTKSKAGTGHPSVKINRLYNLFVEDKLIAYEKAHLEFKYEDYRHLMKEYREGILLFEIMENEVWSRSGKDSVGLSSFYYDNLENYKVNETASLITFEVGKESEVQRLIDKLTILTNDTTLGLENVKELVLKDFPDVGIENIGNFTNKDPEWVDAIKNGPGAYPINDNDNRKVIFVMNYKPESVSKLNDIKGLVISDYQDYLDRRWIESLRSKYKIKVNKSELKKLYHSLVP